MGSLTDIAKTYIYDDSVDKVHMVTKDWRVLFLSGGKIHFLLHDNQTFFFFKGTVEEFMKFSSNIGGVEVDRLENDKFSRRSDCEVCQGFGYLDWLDKMRGSGRWRDHIEWNPGPIYMYWSNEDPYEDIILVRRNLALSEPEYTVCETCFGCGLGGVSHYSFVKILV